MRTGRDVRSAEDKDSRSGTRSVRPTPRSSVRHRIPPSRPPGGSLAGGTRRGRHGWNGPARPLRFCRDAVSHAGPPQTPAPQPHLREASARATSTREGTSAAGPLGAAGGQEEPRAAIEPCPQRERHPPQGGQRAGTPPRLGCPRAVDRRDRISCSERWELTQDL